MYRSDQFVLETFVFNSNKINMEMFWQSLPLLAWEQLLHSKQTTFSAKGEMSELCFNQPNNFIHFPFQTRLWHWPVVRV
jgi:hypothetical protein